MKHVNAETLRALEDLRQKRDDAREVFRVAEQQTVAAHAAEERAREALHAAERDFTKALAEAYDVFVPNIRGFPLRGGP